MARKPTPRTEFVLFNVYYEDDSRRSNRRVPADLLGGIDCDEPARAVIADCFPERDILQVDAMDIVQGGGGIHCITQQ